MGTGQVNDMINDEKLAIIPRSIAYIFDQLSNIAEFDLYASFLEIYNEEVIDLLNPSVTKHNSRPILTIREDSHNNIYVAGLTEEKISGIDHLMGILHKGSLCRTTKSTEMNLVSSRSHAVFSLLLRQKPEHGSDKRYVSKIHFVDLAGSERVRFILIFFLDETNQR
jgi:hypothetical protein